ALTLLARMESRAMVTPSFIPWMRCWMTDMLLGPQRGDGIQPRGLAGGIHSRHHPDSRADPDAEDHAPQLDRGGEGADQGDQLGEGEAGEHAERGAHRAEGGALDEELAHD